MCKYVRMGTNAARICGILLKILLCYNRRKNLQLTNNGHRFTMILYKNYDSFIKDHVKNIRTVGK